MALLPQIYLYARFAFRHLDDEAREEAVQAVIAGALAAYVRLVQLGKESIAYARPLASYAIRQFNDGRRLGSRLNIHDVSSGYCQRRKGVKLGRLDHFSDEENGWKEAVVVDTRTAGVPEIVGFRVDFAAWLRSLPRKQRRIARALLMGHSTSDVAAKFGLSKARISQLRRELHLSWLVFQHEPNIESTQITQRAPQKKRLAAA